MSNPTINFRLSPYQLARGLQIIRQLEPSYRVTSLSQIVKVIYYDYIAKMSLNKTDEVPEQLILEIQSFIKSPGTNNITLDDLIESQQQIDSELEESQMLEEIHSPEEIKSILNEQSSEQSSEPAADSDESIISSVSDFSPPEDWK